MSKDHDLGSGSFICKVIWLETFQLVLGWLIVLSPHRLPLRTLQNTTPAGAQGSYTPRDGDRGGISNDWSLRTHPLIPASKGYALRSGAVIKGSKRTKQIMVN